MFKPAAFCPEPSPIYMFTCCVLSGVSGSVGAAYTVTPIAFETTLPFLAVIFAVPAATEVIVPLETVATSLSEDSHVSSPVAIGNDAWSKPLTVTVAVSPAIKTVLLVVAVRVVNAGVYSESTSISYNFTPQP